MYSFNEIVKRVKGRLASATSKIEGTFTMDNVQAVGQELAEIHATAIEPIKDAVFLDTAAGADLDRRGADFNETRHPAMAATGKLRFAGAARTFVPEGATARFESLLFSTTEAVRLDSSGEGFAAAICQTVGTAGNVPALVVRLMVSRVEGMHEVTNPEPFEGGTEVETDDAFRTRIYERIRYPITSGNEHYYEYLAKQAPGIWRAKCKGTWAGPGTAKVVLLAAGGVTPDDTLVGRVRVHVEQHRLIGADITYTGAVPLQVAISGSLLLAEGYIIEDVAPAIRAELEGYFAEIAFDKVTAYISYHRVGEMVFRVPGILDITELVVNGDTASVPIGHDEYCVLGEVSFNAN